MSTSLSEKRVDLSAGEECLISSNGVVQVQLVAGVLNIAGISLDPNTTYSFPLKQNSRGLTIYTLEGGSVKVMGEQLISVTKHTSGSAMLFQLVSRTISPLKSCKILVLGDAQRGRTLAAQTLFNMLRQTSEEDIVPSMVSLVDLNCETNSLYTPGCVSGLVASSLINPDLKHLWPGDTNSPSHLTLNFYTGSAQRPTPQNVNLFMHFCQQLLETNDSFVDELQLNSESRKYVVIDAPTPEGELKEGTLYKRLVDLVQPSHVVLVSSAPRDGRDKEAEGHWSSYLQEDVLRVLPDCNFTSISPLPLKAPFPSPRASLQQEYFIGNSLYPLGVSKVVLSYGGSSLQFLSFVPQVGGGGVLSTQKRQPDASWKGLLCVLSHAETMEEVPLAPVVGQFAVVDVDEANQELVVIVPAAEQALQRRFVIIPSVEESKTMQLSQVEIALLEESLSV